MRAFPVWEFGGSSEEDLEKILGTPTLGERSSTATKGRGVAFSEDIRALTDSLQMCKTFSARKIGMPETMAGILNAVTGRGWTEAQLIEIGERISNLERLFNLKAGLTKDDDNLPPRLLNDPIPAGPMKGKVSRLPEMLPAYYKTRGWDENGVPTQKKLKALGLDKLKFVE